MHSVNIQQDEICGGAALTCSKSSDRMICGYSLEILPIPRYSRHREDDR
jgi:hypothetical protein